MKVYVKAPAQNGVCISDTVPPLILRQPFPDEGHMIMEGKP
ncbi:MAG: hypothetical protein NWF05_04505 [Candidatus Bathyarchaeota archaeon]|nr:hypothetical protein [Candidatus Bathyarchaeota archaeon]